MILESWSWLTATATVVGFIVVYVVVRAVYNLYFHPLAKFPGPKLAAISPIFFARTSINGRSIDIMKALHEKYGDVVRWAPDELSFNSAQAWDDIYKPHKPGEVFVKDTKFYIADETLRAKQLANIIDPEEHHIARKMLDHAFSPKALSEQEDMVIKYADMLMTAMNEESRKGPINLKDYYNWVTFDVLGELAFSESFGSVKNRKTASWVATILNQVKFLAYDGAIYRVSPVLWKWMPYFIPADITKAGVDHVNNSKAKILHRMEKGDLARRDFSSYLFEKKDELKLNDWNLAAYAQVLIVAGSETSATTLSAMTYYLCRNPAAYQKLKDEVRGAFRTVSDISSVKATLPYVNAVINESLRIFPPVPVGLSRITPKGGARVAGFFVPGGTTVAVHPWSVTHDPRNFKDPYAFAPERWLDPVTDNLNASQPFLLGTRNCIGQNMAWMELRILVAKMVFLFDFELIDGNLDWVKDGSVYRLWEKPDLWTKVTLRPGLETV